MHFPDHPRNQTKFTLTELWQERCRLSDKWFKTKADKKAISVLDEAMVNLLKKPSTVMN